MYRHGCGIVEDPQSQHHNAGDSMAALNQRKTREQCVALGLTTSSLLAWKVVTACVGCDGSKPTTLAIGIAPYLLSGKIPASLQISDRLNFRDKYQWIVLTEKSCGMLLSRWRHHSVPSRELRLCNPFNNHEALKRLRSAVFHSGRTPQFVAETGPYAGRSSCSH